MLRVCQGPPAAPRPRCVPTTTPGLEHLQPLLGAWLLGLLTSSLLLLGELLHHAAMAEVEVKDMEKDTKYSIKSSKSSKATTSRKGTKPHKTVSWRIP